MKKDVHTQKKTVEAVDRRAANRLILVFILLATGILSSGYFYYLSYEKQFRSEVERHISAIAEIKVEEIVDWREERLGDAAVFYKNAAFSALVHRFFNNQQDQEAKQFLKAWVGHFKSAYQYDRVLLLDTRGVARISAPDSPEPVAPHLLQNASEAMRSGKITFLDFHRDAPDGKIHLSILVPVIDGVKDSRSIGLLVLRIDPQHYLYPFIVKWPTPSRTAETLLIRREGNYAVFLNELRFQKNTALNLRSPLGDNRMPAVKAALGEEGIVEGIDYRGVPVIADVRSVPNSPWFLVARMDIAEMYTPLREKLWGIVILIGAFLICAGASTGFIWRHQRERFYREKFEKSKALRASEETQRMIVETSPLAIIVTDPQGRVTLWNSAAGSIFGWRAEEVAGRENPIVPPDEYDRVRQVRQEVMEGKLFVDIETERIRKNGDRIAVSFSATALRDSEGRAKAILAIVADITERKQAEERIRKLNRTLAMLSDINQAIVRIREPQALFNQVCGIAVEKGNFPLTWIGLLDESTKKLRVAASAGKSEGYLEQINISLGNECRECCPIENALLREERVICTPIGHGSDPAPCQKIALELGFLSSISFPLKVFGTIRGTVNFYSDEEHFFDDEEIKLLDELAMDISFAMEFADKEAERKQAEENLRYVSSLHEAILSAVPDIIIEVDAHKVYTWANKAGMEFFGTDVIGKEASFYFEGEQKTYNSVQPLFNGRENVIYVENWQRRRDGEKRLLAWWCRVLKDADGNVTGALSSAQDITERKNMEEALRKSEERFRTLVESAPEAIFVQSQGRFIYLNPAMLRLIGATTPEKLLGKDFMEQIAPEYHEAIRERIRKQSETGKPAPLMEQEYLCMDGSRVWVEATAMAVRFGNQDAHLVFLRDITERKRADLERNITVDFLHSVNSCSGTADLVRESTTFYQQQSGCEAVGIRLKDGDDYPYYEARGFPKEFVRMENKLCARSKNGEVIRDSAGNPVLECMCGNILCGRFDPSKPFFSPGGSFWTNSTTDLLATTTEADRQARTRNRCNGEGYESVALIPLRVGEDRLGLIQLNSRQKGMFTPEIIASWERLAGYLAVALAKFRAEENLRQSEEHYRTLFENMLNGFAYCRMLYEDGAPQDFMYLEVNTSFEKLTGLRDVVGKKVSEVIPGIRESDPGLFEIYSRVALTGTPEQFEIYVEALEMWFSVTVYSPQKEYFVAVFDVINERKRSEQELAVRNKIANIFLTSTTDEEMYNEVLRVILEAMESKYGVVGYIDEDGALVVPSMSRHIWDKCQVPDKTFIFERDKWGHSSWPRAIREKKPNYTNEPSTLTPEGHIVITRHISMPIVFQEEVIGLIQVANKEKDYRENDVRLMELLGNTIIAPILKARLQRDRQEKARKLAEAALRENERRLREAQQMAQLGYWRWNVSTGDVEWSEEVYRIFHLDPNKFTPHIDSILALSPWPEDHERDKELIRKATENHEMGFYEQRFLRPDGSIGYYQSTFQGSYDEGGNIVSIVGTILDITERKKAEDRIRKLNAELEQRVIDRTAQLEAANRELEAFSYSVSHDLRAPVRHIASFVGLLMEDSAAVLDENSKRYLDIIADSTKHMGHLIDDILSFSRMGRAEMQKIMVDFDQVLHEAIILLQPEISRRDVVWDIHPLPEIYGDQSMLQLVWVNLIGNAVKYTGKKEQAKIEIGYREEKNDYVFYVRDNGEGFDMTYEHKLFTLFQRLHRAEEFEGTGVGLANVRRIIQRHGGRTWAEGKIDEGATFYFSLPKIKKKEEYYPDG
jgi:PAS domain S-box-containing protein